MNTFEQVPSHSPKPENRQESNESDQKDLLSKSLKEHSSQFVAGKIIEGKETVHEGDKSSIYRCFEADISLPDIENPKFRLDYRKFHDPADHNDQLRFEYTLPGESGDEVSFAEMHLGVFNENTFLLEHRYVKPDYRGGRGLGSSLLSLSEEWVQEVANERQESASIVLKTGQEDVINWLEKRGYKVSENDQDILNELREHPEHFIKDQVILSEESTEAGIVKSPYTFRKEEPGRYMEDAIRLTFEKTFNPALSEEEIV